MPIPFTFTGWICICLRNGKLRVRGRYEFPFASIRRLIRGGATRLPEIFVNSAFGRDSRRFIGGTVTCLSVISM